MEKGWKEIYIRVYTHVQRFIICAFSLAPAAGGGGVVWADSRAEDMRALDAI